MKWKIVHIDETDSTNRWLKDHGEGTMVVATDYQTAGKGCGSNAWESERGKNLTFSMLIHPDGIAAREQFRITEVVSVALCRTLQPYIYNKVEIKWPNDIYVGDRKLCGILIENRLQGNVIVDCIIGIGLNVNQRVFLSDAPNPVSMYQLTGQETDREALLADFLQTFDQEWQNKTNGSEYRELLYRKGKDGLYEDKTGRFVAKLTDVLPDGRLLLVDEEGKEHTYAFKEVSFIIEN
ncbi:BirA family transcriptional regulator, biotin operon repressor / biotin-[acetyl-CoA-carboxylase] ligase [Prevotella sp. ne3005]|uniref:biotin--[acetyl-CoA-carboxylase] ligase n=1 Tax=Prevotella sp. ne3005 TaxID=1761887 RepID=UPI0008C60A01|nr:biotin--[acetyl-CoA-carboxylase] ligase [Prevotella sp. ne3005]SEN13992.1 BirA family transcriptional regulator, biotin operon repressor / biotin-[acetyl-CoA-carboxylase] ligase [Prevotella sp. ne3005]